VIACNSEITKLCISRDSNRLLQRQVYIKFFEQSYVQALIHDTQGHVEYKYKAGGLSNVNITSAGMGTKTVRVINYPPDVTHAPLNTVLATYGAVLSITDERRSPQNKQQVHSVVCIVSIQLTKHIPSLLTVAAHRVQLRYVGQPNSCFGCVVPDYLYTTCPSCHVRSLANREHPPKEYANIVSARKWHSQSLGDGCSDDLSDNYPIDGNTRTKFQNPDSPTKLEERRWSKPSHRSPIRGPTWLK
jgi:hypothetical protein